MNITKSECERILSKELENQTFIIRNFHVSKLGEFLGFLGEYYQLIVNAKVDKKTRRFSYFVKTTPVSNQRERKIQSAQGFHKKEIAIYREIFSKITIAKNGTNDCWCPEFFLSNDEVLVLEDLSSKGYKTLPFRYKFQKAHIEEALKALARFHSCSIVFDDRNPGKTIGDEFKDILIGNGFVAENPWLQNGFKTIEMVATTRTKYSKTHKSIFEESLIKKLHEMFERMYRPTVDVLKVLCNSDVWKSNLMFTFADDESFDHPNHCMLLDFQIAKYLPLPIDVLMVIIVNTRRSQCKELIDQSLKFYYENLNAELMKNNIELKSKMTFEMFRASCDYFNLMPIIYNAISLMISHIPTEFYTQMTLDQYEAFTVKNRNDVVNKFMDEDSLYRDCVIEAVEEIIEYLYDV